MHAKDIPDIDLSILRQMDFARYITLITLPRDVQRKITPLFAFQAEILKIVRSNIDPALIEIKLQWWEEAVLGLRIAEAQSVPLLRALRESFEKAELSTQILADLIEARRFDIYCDQFDDMEDVMQYYRYTQGNIYALSLKIIHSKKESATPVLERISELAGIIHGLSLDISNINGWHYFGKTLIPRSLFTLNKKLNESEQDIFFEALSKMLQQVGIANDEYINLLKNLEKKDIQVMRTVKIFRFQHKKNCKSGTNILSQMVELSKFNQILRVLL